MAILCFAGKRQPNSTVISSIWIDWDRAVAQAVEAGIDDLDKHISAEDCGISHVLLNGLVRQLHGQNLRNTAERYRRRDDSR